MINQANSWRNLLRSVTGLAQVLVVAHLLAVGLVYLFMPRQQGLSYHFSEEPLYYQILFNLDSPSLLITGLIFYPFYSQGIHATWVIGLYLVVLLVITSTQWALTGYVLSKIWKSWRQYRMH